MFIKYDPSGNPEVYGTSGFVEHLD